MPQKKSSLTSGSKLLKLFRKLLTDPKKHFLSDLSNYLNCSSQSVIRMIGEIEQEFDNRLEQGFEHKRRWYRFKAINANSLGLDVEEVRYLSICRDLADPFLSDEIKDRIDKRILSMAIELIGENRTYENGVGQLIEPEYSFFMKGKIDYSKSSNVIKQLEAAIKKNTIVNVDYFSVNSGSEKSINFIPLKIICNNSAIYIIGCRLNDNYDLVESKKISLAVHRIKDVFLTDKTFKVQSLPNELMDFGLPWESSLTEFLIRFKAGRVIDYIKERIWAKDQKIRLLPNGDLELSFKTKSVPEVYAWCRSFGDQVALVKKDGVEIQDLQSRHF